MWHWVDRPSVANLPALPQANKAKLAIDVRLTRRMSDASATFMACACHGLVLSPSLSAAQCVMCRRKCLHLDMKELRECGAVCKCVCVCVGVCACVSVLSPGQAEM